MTRRLGLIAGATLALFWAGTSLAQTQRLPREGTAPGPAFALSSPALTDGAALPDDPKCSRDGGDGASPPLTWKNPPRGTEGYALVMHHYPHGTYPGIDAPSHYWLLWDVPASAAGIERGNPEGLGYEGADKDMRRTGYTPPCSPAGGATHQYTITVYAVDGVLEGLPQQDDPSVTWADMMAALRTHVRGAASISFVN